MAYELRRVPPNWKHPRDESGKLVPMFGEPYEDAHRLWLAGDPHHPADEPEPVKCDLEKPERGSYAPFSAAEATRYQIYEDTTEGTPISPIFATKYGAVAWLVQEKISYEDAEAFVELGHVPTEVTFVDGTSLRGFNTAARILKEMREREGRMH